MPIINLFQTMKSDSPAILLLVSEDFIAEGRLILKRLISLRFNLYFRLYVACKSSLCLDSTSLCQIEIPNVCSTWAKELIYCLDRIEEEYVIYLLDDFYLLDDNTPSYLLNTLLKAISYNPDLIRFKNSFSERTRIQYLEDQISRETALHKYSMSLVFPCFKVKFLQSIVHDDDSPWKFERSASQRFLFSSSIFIYITEQGFSSVNLVVKGRLLRTSVAKIKSDDRLSYLFSNNKSFMPFLVEVFYHLKLFLSRRLYLPHAYK